MDFTLFTKFALTVTGLFLRKVKVAVVAIPACTVTWTGSAIQFPEPLMLVQATLKASALRV
jgi:hypothetical protein